MKNLNSYSLEELSMNELSTTEGGNFWYDAAWCVGFVARGLYEFGKAAGEYQASLPANLKK